MESFSLILYYISNIEVPDPILAEVIDLLIDRALGHLLELNDLLSFLGHLSVGKYELFESSDELLPLLLYLTFQSDGSLLSLLQFIRAFLLTLEANHQSL